MILKLLPLQSASVLVSSNRFAGGQHAGQDPCYNPPCLPDVLPAARLHRTATLRSVRCSTYDFWHLVDIFATVRPRPFGQDIHPMGCELRHSKAAGFNLKAAIDEYIHTCFFAYLK